VSPKRARPKKKAKPTKTTVVAFSDLHADNGMSMSKYDDRGVSDRLTDALDILDRVWRLADNVDANAILFLGDLFERARVDSITFTEVAARLQLLQANLMIPLFLMPGNHDLVAKDSPRSSVDIFDALELPHTFVASYENPLFTPAGEEATRFLGCPYERPTVARRRLADVLTSGTAEPFSRTVPLLHHDIDGGRVGTYSPTDTVGRDIFSHFPLSISGHYHTPQILTVKGRHFYPGKKDPYSAESMRHGLVYLGSPRHLDFADEGEHGAWIFEFVDGKLTEAELYPLDAPRFLTVDFQSSLDPSEAARLVDGKTASYIRVRVKGPRHAVDGLDREVYEGAFVEALSDKSVVRAFSWEPQIEAHHVTRVEVDSTLGLDKMIEAYVDSDSVALGELDEDEVLDYGKRLLAEVRK